MACVLLLFGGLLLRSFQNLLAVDLGFQPESVTTWRLNAARDFDSPAERNRYYDEIVANVATVPGTVAVGLTDAVPLTSNRTWGLAAPGFEYDGFPSLPAFPHLIDHRYLSTMAIPLVAGRDFTAHDNHDRGQVVILNETAARAVFHGADALGRTVEVGGNAAEVIGVVADTRHRALDAEAGNQMYLPLAQIEGAYPLDMVVKAALPAHALAKDVARAIHARDPAMPAGEYQSLTSLIDRAVSPRRFTLQLLGAFALTGLLLAALGIYGVLSYTANERIPEMGVRMALGETSAGVLRRLVGRTLALTTVGLALGTAGALTASRWIGSMLYGVTPTDPMTLIGLFVVLMLVAGLAGFVPARRAARIQAASVLRASAL